MLRAQVPGVALLSRLIRATIDARDKSFVDIYPGHVVRLPAQGVEPPYNFALPGAVAVRAISSGYNAVVAFLTDGSLAAMEEMSEVSRRVADQQAVNIIKIYGNISGTGIAIGPGANVSQL
jgi:hypothetical protein